MVGRDQSTPGGGGQGSEYWWAGIRICQGVVGRDQSTLGGGGQGSEYIRQGVVGRDQSTQVVDRDQSRPGGAWWVRMRILSTHL